MKRTGKFYRKNEAEVMESLGLSPTKNSGSGWIEKEDGQSDFVICQLKSTDAKSISVKQQDIHTLEYNAAVSHKIPMFAIQFLNTGEVWVMVKPEDLCEVSEYIKTGTPCKPRESLFNSSDDTEVNKVRKPVIKSSRAARDRFNEECEEEARKRVKKWKKERRN